MSDRQPPIWFFSHSVSRAISESKPLIRQPLQWSRCAWSSADRPFPPFTMGLSLFLPRGVLSCLPIGPFLKTLLRWGSGLSWGNSACPKHKVPARPYGRAGTKWGMGVRQALFPALAFGASFLGLPASRRHSPRQAESSAS